MSDTPTRAARGPAREPRLPRSGKLIGGGIALVAVVVIAIASCGGGDEVDRSDEASPVAAAEDAPATSGQDDDGSLGEASSEAAGSRSIDTTSAGQPADRAPSTRVTPIDVDGAHLQSGSQGDRVKQLQEALSALGIDPGPADGIFGERTRVAVAAFQKSQGLGETGLAGDETLRAINTALQERG